MLVLCHKTRRRRAANANSILKVIQQSLVVIGEAGSLCDHLKFGRGEYKASEQTKFRRVSATDLTANKVFQERDHSVQDTTTHETQKRPMTNCARLTLTVHGATVCLRVAGTMLAIGCGGGMCTMCTHDTSLAPHGGQRDVHTPCKRDLRSTITPAVTSHTTTFRCRFPFASGWMSDAVGEMMVRISVMVSHLNYVIIVTSAFGHSCQQCCCLRVCKT